ncbi:MAG: hypothetical protein ACJ79S_13275 [Gemmatimonadaceae bacterium]
MGAPCLDDPRLAPADGTQLLLATLPVRRSWAGRFIRAADGGMMLTDVRRRVYEIGPHNGFATPVAKRDGSAADERGMAAVAAARASAHGVA